MDRRSTTSGATRDVLIGRNSLFLPVTIVRSATKQNMAVILLLAGNPLACRERPPWRSGGCLLAQNATEGVPYSHSESSKTGISGTLGTESAHEPSSSPRSSRDRADLRSL